MQIWQSEFAESMAKSALSGCNKLVLAASKRDCINFSLETTVSSSA